MSKDWMNTIGYMNGEFMPIPEMKISPLDHGFLYGDGVFEALRVQNRKVFRMDDHVDRLFRSLRMLRIDVRMTKQEVKNMILEVVRRNPGIKNAAIRLQISRGFGYPFLTPTYCEKPTVVCMLVLPYREAYRTTTEMKGMKMIVSKTRRLSFEFLDSRIKHTNYLNNIMARWEAIDAGVDDVIMLDKDGFVCETPGSNVFLVRDGTLYTPRLHNILEGRTRMNVIEQAEKIGIKVVETDLTTYDLYLADEIFVSSTGFGVAAVLELDGKPVGEGRPGPISRKIWEAHERSLEELGTPAD